MANQPNSQQNRQGQGQRKPDPKVTINLTTGTIKTLRGKCLIPIEVRVFKGGRPVTNVNVRLKRGTDELACKPTDNRGETLIDLELKMTEEEQSFEVRAILDTDPAEGKITIRIPAKESKPKESNDPEDLTLRRYHKGRGLYTVYIRVTKPGGIGAKKVQVRVEYQSAPRYVTTDDDGNAVWENTVAVQPGEKEMVTATVSGIEEKAVIHLRRLRDPLPGRRFLGWLFLTNNGRAMIILTVMALLMIVCPFIGWGNGIIDRPHTTLSEQQTLYNKVAGEVFKEYHAKPTGKDLGDWQKYFWYFGFLLNVLGPLYGILSLREEIAEGIVEGIDKILDRQQGSAGDPLIQKLLVMSGAHGSAHRPSATVTAQSSTENTEQPVKSRIPFLSLLKSSLISDVLVEIVPAIAKNVFRR